MHESFPLNWPLGRERTPNYARRISPFSTTNGRARDGLMKELKLLGASSIVISSNVATYKRGGQDIMYADQSLSKQDPGIAIYYTWKNEQYALACDRWATLADNLQALNKTVKAIRGIERWGTGEMMKAAFAGFKALPAQSEERSCWEVLGFDSKCTSPEMIKQAYREKARKAHPDAGGSTAAMQELNKAYEQALNSI